MNYKNEFEKFAMGEKGLSGLNLHYYQKHIDNVTPYILEEREMRATQMDIFSRLLMDRIIWVSGGVEDTMASIVEAQLLFLDSVNKKDITLQISSPGGSVLAGLGIRDVMNYIKADVATINVGMCASMGSVLLSSGEKGKRSSLIHSKVMTHFVSHSTGGNVQDTRINQLEAEKYNYMLFKILSQNCDKTFDEIYEISRRDKWFNSEESKEIGLIDNIIGLENSPSISQMMEGFEDYYSKEIYNK